MPELRAPFPWFGGKSLAAETIWQALGNVPNYVEPFAGSLATLLGRPTAPHVETVNGDNPQLRIVLCGLEGEHDMPPSWRCVQGASRGASSEKERLWLSPHCLAATQGELFA